MFPISHSNVLGTLMFLRLAGCFLQVFPMFLTLWNVSNTLMLLTLVECLPDRSCILILYPEGAHPMYLCPNIDSRMGSPDVFSVLILIQEWAHLMVQCPNIDFGMGSPDG